MAWGFGKKKSGKRSRLDDVDWPRQTIYFCPGLIILFYTLALAGCISNSPGIPNLYLVKLENHNSTDLSIQLGYFGMCANAPKSIECFATNGASTESIVSRLDTSLAKNNLTSKQLEPLVSLGLKLQRGVFHTLLTGVGILFMISLVLLGALKHHLKTSKPKRTTAKKNRISLKIYARVALWSSVCLSLVSGVGVAQTAGALQFATHGVIDSPIVISRGSANQGLHWTGFCMSVIFAVGVDRIFKTQKKVKVRIAYDLEVGRPANGPASGAPMPPPPAPPLPSLPLPRPPPPPPPAQIMK